MNDPLGVGSLLSRAKAAAEAGRAARAIQLCQLGLNANPSPAQRSALQWQRAAALLASGEPARALQDCQAALALAAPCDTAAHRLLALCYVEAERMADALPALERWLSSEPAAAEAWIGMARARSALGQHERATQAAQRALSHGGGKPARSAYLTALRAGTRHDELIGYATSALREEPDDAELWSALGGSYYALGRAEAVPALRRAVELDPERQEAQCHLSWALLRAGSFEEGFLRHEHRQRRAGDLRRYAMLPWRGEALEGLRLLIWSEQGFGDTLQFARYVARARRLAGDTSFVVPPQLFRLLGSAPRLGPLTTRYPGFQVADRQALVMSLPHLLGAASDPALEQLPLLRAEPERLDFWRARLPPGRKVALAWQGNPRYGGDAWRSMPFRHFGPLLTRYGRDFRFVSLQKNHGREQLVASEQRGAVLDLDAELDPGQDAFVDSLAVLSLVERFITTDTALAHLAGSAGVETWLLLGAAPDWRWQMEGERSRYYPTLRLFRQPSPGDWDGVVSAVGGALEQCAAQRPG